MGTGPGPMGSRAPPLPDNTWLRSMLSQSQLCNNTQSTLTVILISIRNTHSESIHSRSHAPLFVASSSSSSATQLPTALATSHADLETLVSLRHFCLCSPSFLHANMRHCFIDQLAFPSRCQKKKRQKSFRNTKLLYSCFLPPGRPTTTNSTHV